MAQLQAAGHMVGGRVDGRSAAPTEGFKLQCNRKGREAPSHKGLPAWRQVPWKGISVAREKFRAQGLAHGRPSVHTALSTPFQHVVKRNTSDVPNKDRLGTVGLCVEVADRQLHRGQVPGLQGSSPVCRHQKCPLLQPGLVFSSITGQ